MRCLLIVVSLSVLLFLGGCVDGSGNNAALGLIPGYPILAHQPLHTLPFGYYSSRGYTDPNQNDQQVSLEAEHLEKASSISSTQSPPSSDHDTSFKVIIDANISDEPTPLVHGRTNLPDGTALEVSLKASYPACTPECAYKWIDTVVENGGFDVGPFDNTTSRIGKGRRGGLEPGDYTIIVNTSKDSFAATNVKSTLGAKGENLIGKYVFIGFRDDPIVLMPNERGLYYTKPVTVTAQ